jgi:hypothetical protein
MSDCEDKKCKDCNEDYLQGMLPCVTLPELCVDGETCEETYNAQCVRYTGTPIVCGTTTVLSTGMTTEEALRSLANAICLSGGGGLVDLGPLQLCCTTNTNNITTLQNNYTVINNTVNTLTNQISTINTNLTIINGQITALQTCCDASLKKCEFNEFPPSYALITCNNNDEITGQDLFYIDRQHAGLTENAISTANVSGNWSGALALGPQETASAFFVRAFSDSFGVSWSHNIAVPLAPDPLAVYYPVIQAGSFQIPYQNHYSTILNADAYIGLSGIAGYALINDLHISASVAGAPIEAIGIQGIASTSDIENIGGEFISKWRNATSGKNTAIRGRANGSNLNSGYDIEVGKTTDTSRTNIGGKILVKSGAGGTNHGLKIDVSQALGVTYALQLKDTTAAAGKFLKAIDSDGNAIWDTIIVGGGNVTNNNINGTPNYVTKWTGVATIGDSLIQDDGTSLGIGITPDAGALLQIQSSTMQGIGVMSTGTSNVSAMFVTKGGAGFSNTGITAYAIGATSINVGIEGSATTTNGTIGIGGRFTSSGAGGGQNGTNYSIQLSDGTETVVGRYLRNMTTGGRANWANINITEVTNGVSTALLGAPNGIATLDNNSKLTITQMPISVMDYKGTYDIVTNVPVLVDGTGNQGDVYVNTAAGTRTFGPGNTITVAVGDWLIYNGTKWEKTLGNNVGAGTVTSVGLTVGTTGTDVSVSNSPITSAGNITINIPTASATARGLLSSSKWTDFNNKVGGSGTLNYLPKWTPNGSTLGNSKIVDNGTNVYIDDATIGTYTSTKFYVSTNNTEYIFRGAMSNTSSQTARGIEINVSIANNTKSDLITAGYFSSSGSSLKNIGVFGEAGSPSNGTNVGGYFSAAQGLLGSHAVQLEDPSRGIGKFLKCITADGIASWNYLPDSAQIMMSDMTSAITADAGTPKAYWAAPCNGTLTDMFASLRIAQVGGSTFTVLVKKVGTTIGTLTFSAAATTSNILSSAQTFTKGDSFEFFVTQVGDGSARSLLLTLNFVRT